MIGRLIAPTRPYSAAMRPSPPRSRSADANAMYPRYMKNRINIEVSRPSHSHQVPHVGRPQIDPVIRQIAAYVAPAGATARPAIAAKGWRQTSWLSEAAAMPIQPAIPSQADGTWMYRIRTVSP